MALLLSWSLLLGTWAWLLLRVPSPGPEPTPDSPASPAPARPDLARAAAADLMARVAQPGAIVGQAEQERALLEELSRTVRLPRLEEIIFRLGVVGSEDSLGLLAEHVAQPGLAWHVSTAVGRIGGARAYALLDSWLAHPDRNVRASAMAGLGLLGDAGTERLLRLLDDAAFRERAAVYEALAESGDERGRRAILSAFEQGESRESYAAARALVRAGEAEPVLLKALRSGRRWQRKAAVAALPLLGTRRARVALLEAATGDDAVVRQDAVAAIGTLRDDESVELLCALAAEGPRDVRSAAMYALSQQNDERGRRELIRLLDDADPQSIWTLTSALSQMGGAEARDALIGAARGGSRDRRQAAIHALSEFEGPALTAFYEELVLDPDPQVATAALSSFVRSAGPRALPSLEAVIESGGEQVRSAAVDQLGQLDDPGAVALLERLAGAPDPTLADRATGALIAAGHAGPALVGRLAERLEEGSSASAYTVANHLARIGGEQARDTLLAAVREGRSGVADAAAHALGQLEPALVQEAAAEMFRDESSGQVRARALLVLQNLGGALPPELLAEALADPDPAVQSQAARVAAGTGDRQHVAALGWLTRSEDPAARQSALSALGQIGGSDAIAQLGEALRGGDTGDRYTALWALHDVGSPEAVARIHEAARAEDPELRADAVSVLGAAQAPEARTVLREALDDSSPLVRGRAVSALAYAGGREELERVAALLADEQDPSVRRGMAAALRSAGGVVAEENAALIEDILSSLGDGGEGPHPVRGVVLDGDFEIEENP